MPTLTIDADGVRAVANALGSIDSQLKNNTEQLTGQLSTLRSAVQYEEFGATTQLQQALNQLSSISELLQTAQTKLMTVVSDTLHMEQDISSGGAGGVSGDGGKVEGGEKENDGFIVGQGAEGTWKQWSASATSGGTTAQMNGKLLTGEAGYGLQVKDGNINAGAWASGSVASGQASLQGSNYRVQADGKVLTGGAGVGFQDENGNINAGAWAEGSALQVTDQGRFGSKDLGVTGGLQAKVLSGDAFAGIHDSSAGFDVGASWASVDGSVGANVAGVNVGVDAGVEAGINFGVEIGKHTELKLGPFKIGFHIGSPF